MGVRFLRVSNYRAFAPSDGAGYSLSGDAPFSHGINLFVGPNGSGKTSAMNALKRVFGRATETTQRVVSYEHENATDLCAEHHDIARGWWIEANLLWEDEDTVARISHEPLATHHARKLNGIELAGLADTHPSWSLIYDRGFPIGWPREITHLDSPAFKNPRYPENNLYYYKNVWKEICNDALRLLDTDLACTPDELATSYECPTPGCNWEEPLREARCSRCGLSPRVNADGRRHPGLRFRDRNGARLFHASDGQGHVLFMIMEIRKHQWSTSFLLEEPDVYLHPSLQKRFVEYLDELAQGPLRHQFFITSHSPYLLTSVAGLAADSETRALVYRFQYEDRGSREQSGTGVEIPKMSAFRSLLSSVGHSPADVLEPNGVIWVEGPSDMLYVKCWLELFVKGLPLTEQKNARIRWGLDAHIVIYGGSNLGLVDPEPDFWLVENSSAHARLLELAQSRQNAAVLLDRDDGIKEGSVRASIMSAFANANRYVWTQKEPHRTIEDCVTPGILEGTHPLQGDGWLRRVPREAGGDLRWERRGKREAAESYSKWALKYELEDVVDQTSGVLELVSKLHAVVLGWRQ